MRTVIQDKYYLRDLHREIDLYDRKLIHVEKHEVFPTEGQRDAAFRKLVHKRDQLASTARTLAASGIEFHEDDLPRSFRPEGWELRVGPASPENSSEASVVTASAPAQTSFGKEVDRLHTQQLREQESPLASALGDWQNDLAAYKRRRQKSAPVAA